MQAPAPDAADQPRPEASFASAYLLALRCANDFARDGFRDHALGASHVADAIRRELLRRNRTAKP